MPLLLLFAFAIWSRIWLGWWCLIAVALLVIWTVINPRAFPVPENTNNWASKGTFGERVWLNRKAIPIPSHHAKWAIGLTIGISLATISMIYGLFVLDPWATFLSATLAASLKVWFVDRMVWLYEDMKVDHDIYKSWEY